MRWSVLVDPNGRNTYGLRKRNQRFRRTLINAKPGVIHGFYFVLAALLAVPSLSIYTEARLEQSDEHP